MCFDGCSGTDDIAVVRVDGRRAFLAPRWVTLDRTDRRLAPAPGPKLTLHYEAVHPKLLLGLCTIAPKSYVLALESNLWYFPLGNVILLWACVLSMLRL